MGEICWRKRGSGAIEPESWNKHCTLILYYSTTVSKTGL
jgi:hypothetical protein